MHSVTNILQVSHFKIEQACLCGLNVYLYLSSNTWINPVYGNIYIVWLLHNACKFTKHVNRVLSSVTGFVSVSLAEMFG